MTNNFFEKLSNTVHSPRPIHKFFRAVKYRTDRMRGKIWCSKRAVSTEAAIKQITGDRKLVSFYKRFKNELEKARKKQELCLVEMGGAGNLELIYQLCEHVQAKKIIETGVAYGWSSLAFLLSMRNKEGAFLVSTDLPYSTETAPYIGWVVPKNLRQNWKLIKKPDKEALPEALKILPEIDMCHYDSDKTYEGRMFAYPLLWRALRKNGIFISDDVGDNLAFKKFAEQVGVNSMLVKWGKKYIGILIK